MRAMVLSSARSRLEEREIDLGAPPSGCVELSVRACAVCRTDLHILDGELTSPKLPLIPGHEIIGVIEKIGAGVDQAWIGRRVGVPWLGFTCGKCRACLHGQENLCDLARFTGYQIDGGFAERAIADLRYCFPIPDTYDDVHAAPLMCAGLIGYRSLSMTGDAERLGIYGFGAAAHIVAQVARHQGRRLFAFTRAGDRIAQDFARSLGAEWAGDADARPPVELDAAIIFAPIGALVPAALAAVGKGGVVVLGGIHMSDIPSFPYSRIWGERVLRSVANLTRADGHTFLELAPKVPVRTEVVEFPLSEANEALAALRAGHITGAAVLTM